MKPQTLKKRFETLDAFRGLCALFVLLSHVHIVGSLAELQFFRLSGVFVDFFFVLSGFVLAHGYGYVEEIKFLDFQRARFYRLFPLHAFMLLIFIGLEFIKLSANNFYGISFNAAPFSDTTSIDEILPNLLLVQSWTHFTEAKSFNFPSWSISIEFYIYMIFYFVSFKISNYKTLVWSGMVFVALVLIYADPSPITPEVKRGLLGFFGGCVAYAIARSDIKFAVSKFMGTIVEVFLLVGLILIVQSIDGFINIYVTAYFALLVIAFSFEFGEVSALLKKRPFQLIGKLSYSIYMTHAAILFGVIGSAIIIEKALGVELTFPVNGERYLDFGNTLLNNLITAAIVLIVLAISWLTYNYIELPGQRFGKKIAKGRQEDNS